MSMPGEARPRKDRLLDVEMGRYDPLGETHLGELLSYHDLGRHLGQRDLPMAFETKGTVREARGFTSITKSSSSFTAN